MSILTRSADLVYTLRFIRLLTTDWEDMNAFKLGIIDANGKRIPGKKLTTEEEKSSYNTFHRLVFSLKRLLNKAPGGRSRIASYAAALFLIKEHTGMSEDVIERILEQLGIRVFDLVENYSKWYIAKDEEGEFLSPGVYRLQEDKILNNSYEPMAFRHDTVRVFNNCRPKGSIFGIDIYEVRHEKTSQSIYVSAGDLIR
jgi:hypothetical protein